MDIHTLTPAQCVLLAVHLASESNIAALHSFTPARHDALDAELVLRIVLTYLPEAVDPREYLGYVDEVATRLYLDVDRQDVAVSTASVQDISPEQAKKRVKKLHFLPIEPPEYPPHAPRDLLTKFLCHRAHRIDAETGLLNLVPALIEPYLSRNVYLRTWYISVVLPLLRMGIEYYPDEHALGISLKEFEHMSGQEGVSLLLGKHVEKRDDLQGNICRDIKGLVGPWMYGYTERKRRKLGPEAALSPGLQPAMDTGDPVESATRRTRKISLSGVQSEDMTGHDWEYIYHWMVQHAADRFGLIAHAIDGWDGPSDVDLGQYERPGVQYLDEAVQRKLELQYAQAAFASCYVAQADTEQTVKDAHAILARLAELLDFIPPPDLATSVESLPKIERHAIQLDQSQTVADLLPASLTRPEHPLTTPRMETYMLLQMMVYSAYQLSGLGHPLSLISIAKLHFYATKEEQLDVLRKILRGLSKSGACKDETQWIAARAKLLWLWNWGIQVDPESAPAPAHEGAGVVGKIHKDVFEAEMLNVFIETSCYELAIQLYLKHGQQSALPKDKVEGIILSRAMESYDSATNGNKTRGAMKKSNDIIIAFRPYYTQSVRFQQAGALIAATHALSYYSLTLQHGVPFQPVSIRVSQDPLSLISKVLEQNARSFDKLEDLIDIARHLVSAGLVQTEEGSTEPSAEELARWRKDAERRVTFMAVEAALREDDFETAYSYIVNRLTPSGADIEAPNNKKQHKRTRSSRAKNQIDDDDISWRAAFLAGRYRPQSTSPPSLRRLEQRTELLSLALLLAPVSALTEILAAWRRCEEEMTTLQLSQQQAEQDFDDRADQRLRGGSSALPGNFTVGGEQPELILNQKRREMGRMGAARSGDDETPLSMFDLTRSAARAFSKTAASLQNAPTRSSGEYVGSMEESTESLGSETGSDGQARTRKRDMVANAVGGAVGGVGGHLASGLGWVLGATPVQQQQQQQQRHE